MSVCLFFGMTDLHPCCTNGQVFFFSVAFLTFIILFLFLVSFSERRNLDRAVSITRWPCPSVVLPVLEVLPAGCGKARGEQCSMLSVESSVLPHSFIFYTYKHLYSTSQCGLQGLYFFSQPTFITPCEMHTLDLVLLGQLYSSTALFPLTTLAAVPTSGPGTVFTETLNHF